MHHKRFYDNLSMETKKRSLRTQRENLKSKRVELCSGKFILNFNHTNLESQVKSVRFLLNKLIKWVNRPVKTEAKKTDQVHEESLTIKDGVKELEQECDSDYVTKEYVCEMMKMQESLFRNLWQMLTAELMALLKTWLS